MPRTRIPSYRCCKPKNLGLVVIDGKQHDFSPSGSPESVAEYNRLIQEWLAGGGTPTARIAALIGMVTRCTGAATSEASSSRLSPKPGRRAPTHGSSSAVGRGSCQGGYEAQRL
jgi:carbohydrate-binding DOMON domain-containing protein